jgi:hypothetical protein
MKDSNSTSNLVDFVVQYMVDTEIDPGARKRHMNKLKKVNPSLHKEVQEKIDQKSELVAKKGLAKKEKKK